jgi:murein DD-endopeptidase MepM/ murein hydrolase activator NlpD
MCAHAIPATAFGADAAITMQSGSIGISAPTRASFVPDWDGETDTTAVVVEHRAPGRLLVHVTTAEGSVVRTLVHRRVKRPARRTFYWDGRTRTGTVAPIGTYRFVVRFTPDPSASGGSGAQVQTSMLRSAAMQLQANPLAIRVLGTTRGVMSRRAGTDSTGVRIRLSRPASVSAVVTDAAGRVVKSLLAGDLRAGVATIPWDARDADGSAVADGRYTVRVAASAGQRPTTTQRVPVRIDSAPPVARVLGSATVTGQFRSGRVYIPIRVASSEVARMQITGSGGHAYRTRVPAGASRLLVRGGLIGIRPGVQARMHRVSIRLEDAAGNVRTLRVQVRVRARVQPEPETPAPSIIGGTAGGWIWPARGCLSSPYGPRGASFHYGLDVAAPTGTPTYAARAGTVSFAGTMSGYGNIVIVEHPGGVSTRYAHLSRIDVSIGDIVARGQVVGLIGSTGRSTGPHLHFEIRVGEVAKDPITLLPSAAAPPRCWTA